MFLAVGGSPAAWRGPQWVALLVFSLFLGALLGSELWKHNRPAGAAAAPRDPGRP
jgi:hypothetical protein